MTRPSERPDWVRRQNHPRVRIIIVRFHTHRTSQEAQKFWFYIYVRERTYQACALPPFPGVSTLPACLWFDEGSILSAHLVRASLSLPLHNGLSVSHAFTGLGWKNGKKVCDKADMRCGWVSSSPGLHIHISELYNELYNICIVTCKRID